MEFRCLQQVQTGFISAGFHISTSMIDPGGSIIDVGPGGFVRT